MTLAYEAFIHWQKKKGKTFNFTRTQFEFAEMLVNAPEADKIGDLRDVFKSVYEFLSFANNEELAMAQKWIVEKNVLKLGHVELHADLMNNKQDVLGGGWWHLDRVKNIMYLYGSSHDFGQVTREQLESVVRIPPSVRKMQLVFSTSEKIADVLKMEPNITLKS